MGKAFFVLVTFFFQLSNLTAQQNLETSIPVYLEKQIIDTVITSDGRILYGIKIDGKPPQHYRMPVVEPTETTKILGSVPAYSWSFGCSPTSAAMMAGYYDNIGYNNIYTGPTNGGVAPMDNTCWPTYIDSAGDVRAQCPLSATCNGLDGRVINGHVDDYWISYGSPGPDPWNGNWQQHLYGDCTADYMKTNQWICDYNNINLDGQTMFYNWGSWGYRFTPDDAENLGVDGYDGMYGLKQFFESRGYSVENIYTQFIDEETWGWPGFEFQNFKNQINAGRPVLIHVTNHTMLGIGYDDSNDTNWVYLHDTWDHQLHKMQWNGYYGADSLKHYGVTVVELEPVNINYWTAAVSNEWENDNNWSKMHVPFENEPVVIASECIASSYPLACGSLKIEQGGALTVTSDSLTVNDYLIINNGGVLTINQGKMLVVGNIYVKGEMNIVLPSSNLHTFESVYLYDSVATFNLNNGNLDIGKHFIIGKGGNYNINGGTISFSGYNNSYIVDRTPYDFYFPDLVNNKHNSAKLVFSSLSAYPGMITILGNYSASPDGILASEFIGQVTFSKGYDAYRVECDSGVFYFTADTVNIRALSGNYYNNICISGNTVLNLCATSKSNSVMVRSLYEIIEGGILNLNDCDLYIHKDLEFSKGAIIPGSGKTVFDGNEDQYCNFGKFHRLVLQKPSNTFLYITGNVECDEYERVSGCIKMFYDDFANENHDTLTINDLIGDGIGGFSIDSQKVVNIYQSVGYCSLDTCLEVKGIFNVFGSSISKWPFGENASLTLSDSGIIDFHNTGIILDNSNPNYNLTTNITGGTIRLAKSLQVYRDDFNPEGGTVEFYGSQPAFLHCDTGSTLHNVVINKSNSNISVTLGVGDLILTGDLTILDGNLRLYYNNDLYVGGDWINYIGDGGFREYNGTVIFNGTGQSVIRTDEVFYNLKIEKQNMAFDNFVVDTGREINVINNFDILSGGVEMEDSSAFNIDGNLFIAAGAGLNVNYDDGIIIRLSGDFVNDNSEWNQIYGYSPGTEMFIFDGASNQTVYSNCSSQEFGNLIIDKVSGIFQPDTDLYIFGNCTLVQGVWADNKDGLTHSFEQNFSVGQQGYISQAVNHNTMAFVSEKTSFITLANPLNNGCFTNLVIDKSAAKHYLANNKSTINRTLNKTVTLGSDLTVGNGGIVTLINGTFDLEGNTLSVSGDFDVNNNGILIVDAGATLKINGNKSLNINSGGQLKCEGVPDTVATITHCDTGYYSLNVFSNAMLWAKNTLFKYIDENGLFFRNGSVLSPFEPLQNCTFDSIKSANMGTCIQFGNMQNVTCQEVTFKCNPGYNVLKSSNIGDVTFKNAKGDYAGPDYEFDPTGTVHWTDMQVVFDIKALLEGPFSDSCMTLQLNDVGVIPLTQPFDSDTSAVWYYCGAESVAVIPPGVVDWVLVQLRDADYAGNAGESSIVAQQAGFILYDGTITALDGINPLTFSVSYSNKLYPVILHRNHLGIIAASNKLKVNGVYTYDFTINTEAYGFESAQTEVAPGIWAMISGDANGSGTVDQDDISVSWQMNAGKYGYRNSDLNLDSQTDNKDKNEQWLQNNSKQSFIPE